MRFLLLVLSFVSAAAAAQDRVAPTSETSTAVADAPSGHGGRPAVLADSVDRPVVSGPSPSETAAPAAVGVRPRARSAAPPSPADAAGRSSRNVLTLGGVGGTEEVGVRAAFARRPITDARWSFPVGVEVSTLLTGNGDGGFGLVSAVGGAVQAARRLGRSTVYLQPGLQLSGGNESVYYGGGLFLGGRLSLDLVRYPTRSGVVAGVGVYGMRRLGSDVYNPSGAGVSVTLGAQF